MKWFVLAAAGNIETAPDTVTLLLFAALIALVFLVIGIVAGTRISRAFIDKRISSELERQKTELSAHFEAQIPEIRSRAVQQSRAVLSGKFAENLSPYMPGFNYYPDEARFLGNPVDFVVFEGASQGNVTNVVFVEVKSGGSRPTPVQQSIRKAVEQGRVKWELYRVPGELTENRTKKK